MDFDLRKPMHWLALLMIIPSFIVFLLVPIISYFLVVDTSQVDYINQISPLLKLIFEIFALLLQASLVVVLMIISPYLWYRLVNGLSLKAVSYTHLTLPTN